jgi:hypothetical protein
MRADPSVEPLSTTMSSMSARGYSLPMILVVPYGDYERDKRTHRSNPQQTARQRIALLTAGELPIVWMPRANLVGEAADQSRAAEGLSLSSGPQPEVSRGMSFASRNACLTASRPVSGRWPLPVQRSVFSWSSTI